MLDAPDAPDKDAPIAFVTKQRGAQVIAALTPAALTSGLVTGLTLADARARVPELACRDHDPDADARLLERIADNCDRFTPNVAIDPPDGITLDITGAAHLWDGESALVEDVENRFARFGLHLRIATASTPEGAQALARFQSVPANSEGAAIRRLPVSALRLEEETEIALRRAGMRTVGDLAVRPIAPLAARFGEAMVGALDRLLGRSDSRIDPHRPLPDLFAERRFAEPLGYVDGAMAILAELAEELADAMRKQDRGGRRFTARFYRSDGITRTLRVETLLPTREPQMVMRLFAERIATLADPIDPGFGFDMIRMRVPILEPLAATQLKLEGGAMSENAMAALIDRLSTRIGRGRIRRLIPRNSNIPEQGVLALPAQLAVSCQPWDVPQPGEPPLRPIHLFDPPQRIEVIAEVPDGPPRRFRWRCDYHEITRYEGPERIAPEWWHDSNGLARDYYRVEDARGRRFWLFRHGLYGVERVNPGWYVHGLFA